MADSFKETNWKVPLWTWVSFIWAVLAFGHVDWVIELIIKLCAFIRCGNIFAGLTITIREQREISFGFHKRRKRKHKREHRN